MEGAVTRKKQTRTGSWEEQMDKNAVGMKSITGSVQREQKASSSLSLCPGTTRQRKWGLENPRSDPQSPKGLSNNSNNNNNDNKREEKEKEDEMLGTRETDKELSCSTER